MRVECHFFGPLRDAVGTKTVARELPAGATVADLVRDLAAEFDAVEERVLDGDEVGEDVNVTVDGRNVRQREGAATELSDGATVRFAPPVVGG
ncbi:MAG: ubiquitin-like small modifier protein 1 [Haloferacaceae archaeon]